MESSTSSYDTDEHEAYTTAVLLALHGIISMTKDQFSPCYSWASTIFANMILCDDVDVRSCVSEIFLKHIIPMVSQ